MECSIPSPSSPFVELYSLPQHIPPSRCGGRCQYRPNEVGVSDRYLEATMTAHRSHQIKFTETRSVTRSTRRSFVKLAAASTLAGSVTWLQGSRSDAATVSPPGLGELPRLDGDLLLDAADRQAATGDFGYQIYRSPIAVLKPKSVDDVIRIITYANKRDLKVAMRHWMYAPHR